VKRTAKEHSLEWAQQQDTTIPKVKTTSQVLRSNGKHQQKQDIRQTLGHSQQICPAPFDRDFAIFSNELSSVGPFLWCDHKTGHVTQAVFLHHNALQRSENISHPLSWNKRQANFSVKLSIQIVCIYCLCVCSVTDHRWYQQVLRTKYSVPKRPKTQVTKSPHDPQLLK